MGESNVKSLYDKKIDYAKMVLKTKKPKVSTELVQEIEERVKQMNKRRVRKNKKKSDLDEGDSD